MTQKDQNTNGRFPLVATHTCSRPSAQLVLKDDAGEPIQQWLISQNKCTLGSSDSSDLQCQAPGIAPFHVLLVVGARQIFIRALAPKLTCDGVNVNEILLHEERNYFEVAGHRFEISRLPTTMDPGDGKSENDSAKVSGDQRLKFTLARPLALQQRASLSNTDAESKLLSLQTRNENRWISGLIQSAVEPLECQLRNVLEPLAELQKETRRQRQLLEEQREIEKSSAAKRLAEALESSSVGQLSEQMQNLAASQSAKIDLVKERISDLNQQIATLEKIVSQPIETKLNPEAEEAAERRAADQSEAIQQVSNNLASVSETLDELRNLQVDEYKHEDVWRQELNHRLGKIEVSLDALKTTHEDNTELLFNHVSERATSMVESTTEKLLHTAEAGQARVEELGAQSARDLRELREVSSRTEEAIKTLTSRNDEELNALTRQWEECLQILISHVEEQRNSGDKAFGQASRTMTEELVRELETRTQQTQALVRQLASDATPAHWHEQMEQRVSTLQELFERLVDSLHIKELAFEALDANTLPQAALNQNLTGDHVVTQATFDEDTFGPKFDVPISQMLFREADKSVQDSRGGHTQSDAMIEFPGSGHAANLLSWQSIPSFESESPEPAEENSVVVASEFQFVESTSELPSSSACQEEQSEDSDDQSLTPEEEASIRDGETAMEDGLDTRRLEATSAKVESMTDMEDYDFTHLEQSLEQSVAPLHPSNFPLPEDLQDRQSDPTPKENIFTDPNCEWFSDADAYQDEQVVADKEDELGSEPHQQLEARDQAVDNPGHCDEEELIAGESLANGIEAERQSEAPVDVVSPSWTPEDPWKLTPHEPASTVTAVQSEGQCGIDDSNSCSNDSTAGLSEEHDELQPRSELSTNADPSSTADIGGISDVGGILDVADGLADGSLTTESEAGKPSDRSALPSWWTDEDVGDFELSKSAETLIAEQLSADQSVEDPVDLESYSKPSSDGPFELETLGQIEELVNSELAEEASAGEWPKGERDTVGDDSSSSTFESEAFWATIETGNSHDKISEVIENSIEGESSEELNLLANIAGPDALSLDTPAMSDALKPVESGGIKSEGSSETEQDTSASAQDSAATGKEDLTDDTRREESVEQYMERLLIRVRRQEAAKSAKSTTDRHSELSTSTEPASSAKSQPSVTDVAVAHSSDEAHDPATEKASGRRAQDRKPPSADTAPSAAHGFAAMRDLANSNARTAIHQNARKRYATAAVVKCVLSIIAVIVGAALFSINGLELGIGLFAALAAFMVAAIWGYDAIASLFPYLQNSLVLKPSRTGVVGQDRSHD